MSSDDVVVVSRDATAKRKYGDFRILRGLRTEARTAGYGDEVLAYLKFTGRASGWCEVESPEDAETYYFAPERVRQSIRERIAKSCN